MKNYENVLFGSDARAKIIEGINLCANAVEATYGYAGKNAIIRTNEGIKITKDGYHTAMMVNDKDPYISMGIDIIQDICRKTAKDIGDGTSTSAILARELINKYKNCNDPIATSRRLVEYSNRAIEALRKNKKDISGKEDLIHVATVSANNDLVIGTLIADAFERVGKDGIVTFEESEDVKDRVEYSEGFRIDNGYSSPYFINTPKGTCELENVLVYISDIKMDEVKPVVELANQCVREKKSLLLIAPEFDSEILVFLSSNLEMLKSCTVISPNHRNFREMMIKDMRALLGTSSICKKVIITKDNTTFLGCESDEEQVKDRVKMIRLTLEEGQLNEHDLAFYKKRLANFTAGIATIHVGGYSTVEMKERFDRVEDAVYATQAALEGGILSGGGTSLAEIGNGENIDNDYFQFLQLLLTPQRLLHTEDKTSKDMYENGIIEPFLVTKTVLENAVSTASLVLTADVAIVNMSNFYMN